MKKGIATNRSIPFFSNYKPKNLGVFPIYQPSD